MQLHELGWMKLNHANMGYAQYAQGDRLLVINRRVDEEEGGYLYSFDEWTLIPEAKWVRALTNTWVDPLAAQCILHDFCNPQR
jgi:hypothetical protein